MRRLGFVAMSRFAVYSASKAGLNAWAVALCRELRGTGVRVVNVSPLFVTKTFTGTGMYEQMLLDLRKAGGGVPPRVPRLHGLWEVSARRVAAHTVAQMKSGGSTALLSTTAVPQRLLGALQLFSPDWFTAWLRSRWCPGDCYFMSRSKVPLAAAARKEE